VPPQTLSVPLDPDIAAKVAAVSPAERKELELLLRIHLRELLARPVRPLPVVMEELSRNAEQRGLTPEILESLIHDE
jgi:hypothetical protein